jgi:hypothetical protein
MPTRQDIAVSSDWLTVTETLKYGKFSRSRLYKLFGEGLIKTFSLRSRGNVRGKRYVIRQSLDEYFNSQCQSQMN